MRIASSIHEKLCAIQGYLYRFSLSLVHDEDKAKDLLQDCNLKILQRVGSFDPNINFTSFCMTTIKNTLIDQARHDAVLSICRFDDEAHNEPKNQECYYMDDTNSMRRAISTNKQGIALLMYADGYKYHEIADKLKIPIGTVKYHIHLARKSLKCSLGRITSK